MNSPNMGRDSSARRCSLIANLLILATVSLRNRIGVVTCRFSTSCVELTALSPESEALNHKPLRNRMGAMTCRFPCRALSLRGTSAGTFSTRADPFSSSPGRMAMCNRTPPCLPSLPLFLFASTPLSVYLYPSSSSHGRDLPALGRWRACAHQRSDFPRI